MKVAPYMRYIEKYGYSLPSILLFLVGEEPEDISPKVETDSSPFV